VEDFDTIEPTECWVITIPCGVDLADPDAWNTYAVTIEVYLTFDTYSERCDRLRSEGVVWYTRHLLTDREYY
jgi:hypothetical protein